jgi:hypothetical protein
LPRYWLNIYVLKVGIKTEMGGLGEVRGRKECVWCIYVFLRNTYRRNNLGSCWRMATMRLY